LHSICSAGCCETKFDSTYPLSLKGIINQDEFEKSIEKINRTVSASEILKLLIIILIIGIVITILSFITGGRTLGYEYRISSLVRAGISVGLFAFIVFIIGLLIVRIQIIARMQEAIAEESMKYSSQSSISCTWRLEATKDHLGEYGNHTQFMYYVSLNKQNID
jgi:amino acid transporter